MRASDAEAIAAAYGCGAGAELHGPVARGEQGEVWRLDAGATGWGVKLLYEQPDSLAVEADAAYQDEVRGAGVPMPRVQRTSGGDVLHRLGGAWIRVYEWAAIGEPDPGLDPAAVGELVAAVHRVRSLSSLLPVDPWYSEPVGQARWSDLIASLTERRAPFAEQLAELRDELIALEGLIAAPRDLQVCHRDLWADNVRVAADGGLCVIDWENAGLADLSQEIAIVLFEFGLGDDRRARALYDAYVAAGGPGRIEGTGRFLHADRAARAHRRARMRAVARAGCDGGRARACRRQARRVHQPAGDPGGHRAFATFLVMPTEVMDIMARRTIHVSGA